MRPDNNQSELKRTGVTVVKEKVSNEALLDVLHCSLPLRDDRGDRVGASQHALIVEQMIHLVSMQAPLKP